MSTVINDLTIEPKATPPSRTATPPSPDSAPKSAPETERDAERFARRKHERALRLWAH